MSNSIQTFMTPPDAPVPESRHAIKVRKPGFDHTDAPRHWLAGNAVATHFFNGLNMLFPEGERFFVEAVRVHVPLVSDPDLLLQVRGFSGQEARHACEHERYFEILEKQGYDIAAFLSKFKIFVRWSTQRMPASFRLSVTAGAEHYTATMGANALQLSLLDQAHPSLRAMILWHAAEEVEHKAVAFDVLKATHPSYLLRIIGFVFATLVLFGWTFFGTRMLLSQDVAAGRLSREEIRRMGRDLQEVNREERRRMMRSVRQYFKRNFHPNDSDDLDLAHRKLEELGLAAGG